MNISVGTPALPPGQQIHYVHYKLPHYSVPLLITWSLLTAVVCLVGNYFVLVGTIQHNAIRLDKLSLVLIKNLAASDIFNTVFVVLPGVGTLYTGRALFQDNLVVCTLHSYILFLVPVCNSLMVCALTLNKLLILLNPLKTLSGGDKTGWSVAVGAWLSGLIPAVLYLIIGERTIVFDTRTCRCSTTFLRSSKEELWMMLDSIFSALIVMIPFLIIIVSSAWMLHFLRKKTSLRRQSVGLILSVSALFLVSFMPFLVYVITVNILKPSRAVKYRDNTVAQLVAAATYVNYLNTMSNSILYYFTSASFKVYVRNTCGRWFGRARRVQAIEMKTASTGTSTDKEKESTK